MSAKLFELGAAVESDVFTADGRLLIAKGTILTDYHIEHLHKHNIAQQTDSVPKDQEQTDPALEIEEDSSAIQELYEKNMKMIEDVFHTVNNNGVLTTELFSEAVSIQDELITQLRDDREFIHCMLQKVDVDAYLFKHCLNVGIIARKIGELLKVSISDQILLARMGLFHDIGKIRVDKSILNKPGRLSDTEFEEIKKHTKYGYDLLKGSPLDMIFLLSSLLHHERNDGTGYPGGIKGEKIPQLIQILSVADTFDAICSNRVYKDGRSIFFAVNELMKDAEKGKLNENVVLTFTAYLLHHEKGRLIPLKDGRFIRILHVYPEKPNMPVIAINDKEVLDLKKVGLTLQHYTH
ncbi:HD-GYP domain-containing protein [Fictibacillus iocasae]|uniref:HD-GYP domain-containing protein n=1 Tax=Fictibacillus iocasae TaxID=2715437 RepID=A0ABW2NLD3_9BACL